MRILGIPIPALFPDPPRTEIEANVASLMRVPRSVCVPRTETTADGTVRRVPGTVIVPLLPDGPARRFLIAEAMAGKDVYAYQPTPRDSGRWNIWYGPLAPRYDARIPAATWHLFWDDLATKAARAHAAATQAITQANGGAQ